MKLYLFLLSLLTTLYSCQPHKQQDIQVSAIDSTLQNKVDSILQNKMHELNATSGRVIVMEVETEAIKVNISHGLQDPDTLQDSGLTRTAALLAALESGVIRLSDTVDVDDGILAIGNDTLLDHNWHRGGYGIISLEQGFAASSNIANYKTVQKIFKDGHAYAEALAKYGYQVKDTNLIYNSIGYGIPVTPLQNLKFYNSIAQGRIASQTATDSIRQVLEYDVTDGFGRPASPDKVKVAGATGTTWNPNDIYCVEFCGYFPAGKPQYSLIVSINKKGLPASGGLMAGDVFRQIVDIMTKK